MEDLETENQELDEMVPVEEILFAKAPVPVKEYMVLLGGWNKALGGGELMQKRAFSSVFMGLIRASVH